MKSLKFRAWSNEHNRYCDFVTLDESRRWIGWIMSSGVYLTTTDINLEQYTGLKDKNGKEIYEGDIVGVIFPTKLRGVEEHQIWVCRFGVKRAGFVLNRETNARIFSLTFGEINAKNLAVEVIGNVHESNMEELCQKE